MSSPTTGWSRRSRRTKEWLESSSSNLLTIDGQSAYGKDEEGLAAQLYSLCRRVLGDLCSQKQDLPSTRPLREELTKLYLWGQSFGPGELDIALEHSDDARYIVLDALGEIGRSLLREISPCPNSLLKPAHADQPSQELKCLVEKTKTITSNRVEKDEEGGSDGNYDTDEDIVSDDEETSDIIQELRSHIRYLVELGPTLQQNLLYARKARTESAYPPVVPFHLSDSAKIYVSLVREKYRNAEDQLIDRLGESNWQRHRNVREMMNNIKRHPEEEDECVGEGNLSVRNQEVLYSAFRPYSTFHDSSIGTSVPAHTEYAASHTSFQSSNVEDAQGPIRVPPTPEEVGAGKPFQCPFCCGTLLNIKNRVDWKLHVFADLQPYICTFANCEKELAQFPTRAAWADHEFTEHRIVRSWSCPECTKQCDSELGWIQHLEKCHQQTFLGPKYQVAQKMAYTTRAKPAEGEECPLCQVVLGKPRREFAKHVGQHMEEIALMALPRDNDEDSEAHSTSTEPVSSHFPTFIDQGQVSLGFHIGSSKDLEEPGPIAPGSPSTLERTSQQHPTKGVSADTTQSSAEANNPPNHKPPLQNEKSRVQHYAPIFGAPLTSQEANKAINIPGHLLSAQVPNARRGMSLPPSGRLDSPRTPSTVRRKKCPFPYCTYESTRRDKLLDHLRKKHGTDSTELCGLA